MRLLYSMWQASIESSPLKWIVEPILRLLPVSYITPLKGPRLYGMDAVSNTVLIQSFIKGLP